ncbi:MAG: hypothetical protein ACOY46_12415 [Bacillota bacterium]
MDNKPPEGGYIPPTYLHCFKYHLTRTSRENVRERDTKLLKYIRSLQESRAAPNRSGLFRSFIPGVRKHF